MGKYFVTDGFHGECVMCEIIVSTYCVDVDGGDSGEAEYRHVVQGEADVLATFEKCEG